MLSKSRGFVTLMISMFVETLLKQLLCYNTSVREHTHALDTVNIHKTFGVNLVFELVMVDDVVWKVCQFNLEVFWPIHGSVGIEIFDVQSQELGALCGYDVVEKQFYSE